MAANISGKKSQRALLLYYAGEELCKINLDVEQLTLDSSVQQFAMISMISAYKPREGGPYTWWGRGAYNRRCFFFSLQVDGPKIGKVNKLAVGGRRVISRS